MATNFMLGRQSIRIWRWLFGLSVPRLLCVVGAKLFAPTIVTQITHNTQVCMRVCVCVARQLATLSVGVAKRRLSYRLNMVSKADDGKVCQIVIYLIVVPIGEVY